MALEDEFSITIAEEDAQKMSSVGDVVRDVQGSHSMSRFLNRAVCGSP